MKTLMVLLVLGLQEAAAVTHSLKFFTTATSQVTNLPEFVSVGMLDDDQITRYDSRAGKYEFKQEWMSEVTAEDPQYVEARTARSRHTQQEFKAKIETLKQQFNHTEGVHSFQWMYGCEWDDETDEVTGFWQYGYDGEDFISFDLKTQTWIAPVPQALETKQNFDSDKDFTADRMNYLTQECPEWGRKYLNYGRSSLMRTVLPSVSLLQKSSSSPITCHATGFHPNRAEMFWKKNGEELHEGVRKGEILTNHDGTFQMSVDLDLSAVGSDDWDRYSCVFQLSGVTEDVTTRLIKDRVRTNEGSSSPSKIVPVITPEIVAVIVPVIIPEIIAVLVLAAVAVFGFIIYRRRADKRPPYRELTTISSLVPLMSNQYLVKPKPAAALHSVYG